MHSDAVFYWAILCVCTKLQGTVWTTTCWCTLCATEAFLHACSDGCVDPTDRRCLPSSAEWESHSSPTKWAQIVASPPLTSSLVSILIRIDNFYHHHHHHHHQLFQQKSKKLINLSKIWVSSIFTVRFLRCVSYIIATIKDCNFKCGVHAVFVWRSPIIKIQLKD